MADENENINTQQEEEQAAAIRQLFNIVFENIVPWVQTGGDTGLSSRLKLKRNFDKIKAWIDASPSWFLSRLYDDTAAGFITFIQGLQVGQQFVTGLLGEGGVFRVNADGTTYLETDKMYVRMKAYFDNVEIRDYRHSVGNRIASAAGARCCRVEYIGEGGAVVDSPENAVLIRCYFRGSDGEDEVKNNFVVGDMAYHHVTDVETADDDPNQKGLNSSHYWRLVVGRNAEGTLTTDGEHWIDLSNRASETLSIGGSQYTHAGYQNDSDVPTAQDDIIQLGNINDTDRQGAIIEFVTGNDAPSYQIFQGINDFSLQGKNKIALGYNSQTGHAYLNVYGDAYIGDPNGSTYIKYEQENPVTHAPRMHIKAEVVFQSPTAPSQDITLEDFAAAIINKAEDLQRQIDGEISSWFYAGVPTLLNLPASAWDTAEKKEKHLGDLYYDRNTGYGYRFVYDNDNEVYMWTQIYDDAIVEALRLANEARDTADHKRRVFLTTPTVPYDAGDLWVNAVWPASGASQGATYNNDILKCVTSKTDSQSFAIADWTKASKYTDDSQFEGYINQILNGTNEQTDPAIVAQALHAIKGALSQDTNITGGLMLTTLIGMRDSNGTLWGGMNGQYNANVYGGGLASWYGGGMIDKYNPTTQQFDVQSGARIGFRFDGSGYVAGGAIAWDATGLTNLNVSSITAATINLGGKGVATQEWVGENYISIAYFDRLFRAFNGDNLVNHNDTQSTINNIKAMFGFWTDTYLSALGNSSGSGIALTLANMGDVQLSTPTNGQALIYNASTQKWTNQTISATGNYLLLTGGTMTGNLFFEGYNSRVFGIKLTNYAAGMPVGTNIDVGWDWENKDGAGAYFRSSDAGTQAGDFGIFARDANGTEHTLRGKYDGTLTWGNANILTSANVKTINGQSIYGSGNIVVGGGTGYLPLTGGTMTGIITLASGAYIYAGSNAFIACRPTGWTSVTSSQWAVGTTTEQGVLRSNANDLLHRRGSTNYAILDEYNATTILNGSYLPLTGGTLTGRLTINASVADVLVLNRTSASSVVRMDLAQGGTVYGNLGLDASHNIILRTTSSGTHTVRLQINTNGNVGIGTTSPNYKLHVNGTIGAGNITGANLDSEGYISALSDIRKKDVVENMAGLTIEQIAKAPIIKFLWKGERIREGLQVGSIAQYWQKILPQSVHKSKDDYLSFSYGVAALISSISTARKVVDHEKRIAELERENRELKMKLENVA
ncbi:hypothetical protein SAMN05216354_0354 [Xylanibacter ruminicola]|uniref:Peptidase S74 domain-containing protein n=1 Tax=Xylanibacter ruminicola TaxID=839 RepID=A0A1H5RXL6_XYLRU|nr:tail fiber domain-containing protein [Xylanibacter ruminicola]SEF42241.1 hypothetical protein SAMN05216354_0354 [Xylanibacter ruminicola]